MDYYVIERVNGLPARSYLLSIPLPLCLLCAAGPLAWGEWYCPACKHQVRADTEREARAARRPPRRIARRAHHRKR